MLTNNTDLPKYLSLKAAAELYGYTRDHLGLMIRRGKLQGMKLGSYYVTTNEWMIEYVKSFSDPDHPTSKNKLSNKFLTEVLTAEKKIKTGSIFKKYVKPVNDNVNKNQNLKLPSKMDSRINFEKEISEELSKWSPSLKYPTLTNKKVYADSYQKYDNNKNYIIKADIEGPYVILPIREMKTNEREDILNKIDNKKNKKDGA